MHHIYLMSIPGTLITGRHIGFLRNFEPAVAIFSYPNEFIYK